MRTLYYKIISIAIVLAGLTACDSISVDDVVKSEPIIESYNPAQASIGDEIIVTGSSLNDVTAATIGGEAVEILQKVSDKRLSLRVTANAKTGKIELTNATGKGSSEGEVVIMTVTPTNSKRRRDADHALEDEVAQGFQDHHEVLPPASVERYRQRHRHG